MEIRFPKWSKLINQTFIPLINNKSRVLICYGGRGCFVGSQEVILDGIVKSISEVIIGDVIPSYNEITQQTELKKVINTFKYDINEEVFKINLLNGGSIIVTSDHKFFYKNEWIEVKKIIQEYDGSLERSRRVSEHTSKISDKQLWELEVGDIESYEIISNIKEVYDIEVEDNHNFYLNTNNKPILVHNSSKSVFAAKKLIYRCLSERYFKCILIRSNYNTIKDSQYDQIKSEIDYMGLSDLFIFKLQPMEIILKANGNKFLCRGLGDKDDVKKLKSITDPTAAWIEEDLLTEDQFVTISTGLRTKKAEYIQMLMTINPEAEGNYQEAFIYKRFFEAHATEKSFTDTIIVPIEDEEIELSYTVHHSTYHDNRWITNEYKAELETEKTRNPYYYDVYVKGNWGNKVFGGLFWKKFQRGKNTCDVDYDSTLPLHISFDFNVNPFITITIWQIKDKKAYCIDEICSKTPNNTTAAACREFVYRYPSHNSGLFIYGDPSGKTQDTRSEKGWNDYRIIEQELEKYHPSTRVASMHPPIVMRGNFINTIFESGFNGIEIFVSETCPNLINDLMFLKEASDGTTFKEKVSKDGVTYEKYGHTSDSLAYMICEAFETDFDKFQNGKDDIKRIYGIRQNKVF
jgi:PBSX family phage terminase large subunit